MTIPVVDLADFVNGNPEQKAAFVQKLGQAYEDVGFVAVKNHGIPAELIADLYKYVQQFFSLPSEKKKKFEIPELAGQRGYTSFGKEHAKGSEAPDLKEFFQYGQIVPADHTLKSAYPDNVKVDDIPGFNETFFKAYRAFEKSGKSLLQAIALYLNLDENYFDDFVAISGNTTVRLYFEDTSTIEPIGKELNELGCEAEISLTLKMLAVNVPEKIDYNPFKEYLDKGEQGERWQYEESCLAHEY